MVIFFPIFWTYYVKLVRSLLQICYIFSWVENAKKLFATSWSKQSRGTIKKCIIRLRINEEAGACKPFIYKPLNKSYHMSKLLRIFIVLRK